MIKNKSTLLLIAILLLAGFIGMAIYGVNKNSNYTMQGNSMMGDSANSDRDLKSDTSSADYQMMAGVQGEEYDRLFLANMISHHMGAVDMANLALKSAKHQEVKDLANAIISAQTTEIASMVSWQKTWGYPASSGTAMMDHSAMGMEDTNAGMMNALSNKTGDDFDKAFLKEMIMHHQSAIDMSASGVTNAKHQEVKDLTVAISTAQKKEIRQMRQWQKTWGY